MIFTILNNTNTTVGPYGSGATTITGGGSYVVNPPVASYVNDSNLRSDILAGNVSVIINNNFLPILLMDTLFENLQLYSNITGNTTKTIKSAPGILRGVIIGDNNTGGQVILYDNTAGNGTVMVQLTIGSPSGGLLSSTGLIGPLFLNTLDIEFLTGLTVVTSGSNSNNITVLYQ
jgi:hypothetical protein